MVFRAEKFHIFYNGIYENSIRESGTLLKNILPSVEEKVGSFKDFDIYLFDSKKLYEDFSYKMDGEKRELSRFSNNIDKRFIRGYLVKGDISNNNALVNELISELIKLSFNELPKWFMNGVASYYSSKYDKYNSKNKFITFYVNSLKEIRSINSLSELNKDILNKAEKKICYFIVKYLVENNYDVIGMMNGKVIIPSSYELISEVNDYYFNNYLNEERLYNLDSVKTPVELMDFLDYNFRYGWVDLEGNEYIDTLEDFMNKMVIMTSEDALKRNLGTCVEQGRIINDFLNKKGLKTKIIFQRKVFEGKDKYHLFIIFEMNNEWYYFEHTNSELKGIRKFKTLGELFDFIAKNDPNEFIEFKELKNIPSNMGYKSFLGFINLTGLNINTKRAK